MTDARHSRNRDDDRHLDSLLKQWAVETSEADDNELKTRVLDLVQSSPEVGNVEVLSADSESIESVASAKIRKGASSTFPVAWIALAACLLVIASIAFTIMRADQGVPEQTVEQFPPSIEITDDDLRAKQKLIEKCVGLFGERFRGVVESDRELELQVEEITLTQPIARSSSVVTRSLPGNANLVRLVFARRPKSGRHWEEIWSRDVIAMNEDIVQLADNSQDRLYIWTHRLPDGNVVADTEFGGQQFEELSLSSSHRHVALPGEVQSLNCVTKGEFEYCVFQSVAAIPADFDLGGRHESL